MELINQLSWCAYFEHRENQQRKSLGKWLLEEGVQGSVWARGRRREVHLYWGLEEKEGMFAGKQFTLPALLQVLGFFWPFLYTGSILQRQAMGKKGCRLPAFFQKEQQSSWKGSFGSPFLSLLLLFGEFPLCKKNQPPSALSSETHQLCGVYLAQCKMWVKRSMQEIQSKNEMFKLCIEQLVARRQKNLSRDLSSS